MGKNSKSGILEALFELKQCPMPLKIAINGFGRIGRSALKIAATKRNLQVVAINDLTDNKTLAHLLKYDTAYGAYDKKVSHDKGHIIVGGKKIPSYSQADPKKLPWKKLRVDVVLECTGAFRTEEGSRMHLKAGARRVIISAPAKGGNVGTFVLGVNEKDYSGEGIINNASCTTNCIAPVARAIGDALGIKKAAMTTIHGYTADQRLQDAPHRDLRRARAAALNIIPTTTGAAKATAETIPGLGGLFDGLAVRVPVITGSLSDVTMLVGKKTTAEKVNAIFRRAAKNPAYKGVLAVTEDPIVSSDIVGNPHSAIVDLSLTKVIDGDLVKVIAWYDNEWGYSNRLVEMALEAGKR